MNDDAKPEAATSMGVFDGGDGSAVFVTPPHHAGNQLRAYSTYDADEESDDDGESVSESSDEDVCALKVIVKLPASASAGENLEVSISKDASVLDLKKRITEELAAIPVDRQRLIFSGRMLSNNDDFLLDDIKMNVDGPNYVHLAPLPQGVQPSRRDRNNNVDLDIAVSSDEERPPLRRGRPSRHLLSRELRRTVASPYGGLPSSHALLSSGGAVSDAHNLYRRPRHLEVQTNRPQVPDIPVYAASTRPGTTSTFPIAGLSVHHHHRHPMMCQEQPVFLGTSPLGLEDAALALSSSLEAVARPMTQSTMVNSLADLDGAASLGLGTTLNREGLTEMHESVQMDIWRRTNEIMPLYRVLPDQLLRVLSASGSETDRLREIRYQTELEDTATLLEQVSQRSNGLATSIRQFVLSRRQHISQASSSAVAAATFATATNSSSNPMADLMNSIYQQDLSRAEHLHSVYQSAARAPYY